MKKIFFFLSTVFFMALFLTGCSNSGNNLNKSINLEVMTMFGEGDGNRTAYLKINDTFNKEYPNVNINDNSELSNEEWKKSVVSSFNNNTEPDVLFFFTDAASNEIINTKKVVSVKEIREKYPDYGEYIKEDVLKTVAAQDGVTYALPLTGYYEGLYCNLDLFEEYNLELPTDWDKFLKAIEVFKENDIVPVAVSLGEIPHYWIEHLILSQGGVEGHSLNPNENVPDSWVKGLDYFKVLYDRGAFPDEKEITNNIEAGELFQNKKAAMQLDGSWYANGLRDKDNTTIIPFPTVPGGAKKETDIIGGFSSGFYITKKAWNDKEKREAAVNYVMAQTTSASIARYWWGAGTPSAESLAPVGMQKVLIDGTKMAALAVSNNGTDVATDARLKSEAFQILTTNALDIAKGNVSSEEIMKKVVEANRN